MWLKVSTFQRSRKPVIGTPTLVGKTLDDNEYQSFPLVSGMQSDNKYYSKSSLDPPTKPLNPAFSARRPEPSRAVSASLYSQDFVAENRRQPSISLTLPLDLDTSNRNGSFSISPPHSPVFIGRGPGSLASSRVSSMEDLPQQQPVGVEPLQEKPRARASSRVHLSRSSDRLRDRDSPSPSDAYLGIVPSVVTTITGGDYMKSAEKYTPSKNIHQTRVFDEPTPPATSASSRAPPRVDLPEPDFTDTLADLKLTNEDDCIRPVSRFSATTYEPTEAASSITTGSPRGSFDAAPQSTENFSSIMSRKRPVPSAVATGKKPSRKPTPSRASNDLSQCPPEQRAQNRLEVLEARKDYLARRKISINTMIYELTQVIQPSPIAYDLAAREEVKKTVTSLNNELADINKEEHEIGMKIFRARRKRDEQGFYGASSGLWVKRVTS
ncbi:hypothetical protein BBP40_002653 [Aspergillus hancockii]|nr:hypothetical protein BBP40_002653 [Aspergillus hancockii]